MAHSSDLIAQDIEQYLKVHENKDMLRFITCGSVDDGKSTLIGRLLFDSKMIFEDQMAAIENDSKRFNTTNEDFDLALLVDGLQSEREQGITIDVAYRYFSTEQRKFIIADTPGHEQYTRNMATGASTSDLAVILVDARHGVQTQTRRHSFICSQLGIKHIIVAINKMDLIEYSQEQYQKIKAEYRKFAEQLNFEDVRFVPISALKGDNVVNVSENMSWYPGATLMRLLNSVDVRPKAEATPDFRFPVQYVNRPNLDFRGFAGTIASGAIRVGDTVACLPTGKETKVESIVTFDGSLDEAKAGAAVTITLEDEIDCSRGDMLVRPHRKPMSSQSFIADVVWMDEQGLQVDRDYFIKVGAREVNGHARNVEYKVDVNTLEKSDAKQLQLNEMGRVTFDLDIEVQFDNYIDNKRTGCLIIIDRLTNNTVGAAMIVGSAEELEHSAPKFSDAEVELNKYIRTHYPHWNALDITKL